MSKQDTLFAAEELDRDYSGNLAAERENENARQRVSKRRAAGRDIEIPAVVDPARRARCEFSLELYCREYFAHLFYLELCETHLDIIHDLQENILTGGRIALAAPRGFGKTTLTIVALSWAIVYGHAKYIVLIAATKEDAGERFDEIKEIFDGENVLIAEDFPEVCAPVIALGGASQKANLQTVDGKRTRLKWGEKRIMFARLKDAPAAGTIVTTRGLDSSIRGLVRGALRPDLIMVDDPQTDESAVSVGQTEKRNKILTNCVEGLVGPGQALTVLSLWTVIVKNDLADKYTSDKKPSYQSHRYRALSSLPARPDLVTEYILLRQDAMKKGDRKARAAHAWYLRTQTDIERGAVAIWKENFVAKDVGDDAMEAATKANFRADDLVWAEEQFGTSTGSIFRQEEISAIQGNLNFIADNGWDAFNSERQNDPPEGETTNLIVIDEMQIREKTSGYARGIVPDDAVAVVLGGDVGRYALHWVAAAVRSCRRLVIIDYDAPVVNSPSGKVDLKTDEGRNLQLHITMAVLQTLKMLTEHLTEHPFRKSDGTPVPVMLGMFDSRYAKPAVNAWADESGDTWQAVMGMGVKNATSSWQIPKNARVTPDGNLYAKPDNRDIMRFHAHADAYKRGVHEGFLLDYAAAGSFSIFEPEDRTTHKQIAEHICAECEEELIGGSTRWVKAKGRKANHFFDATYNTLACVSYIEAWLPEVSIYTSEVAIGDTQIPQQSPQPQEKRRRRVPIKSTLL